MHYPVSRRTRIPRPAANCLSKGYDPAYPPHLLTTQEDPYQSLREGGQPYLGLFDIEKANNSVELPILLQHPHGTYQSASINRLSGDTIVCHINIIIDIAKGGEQVVKVGGAQTFDYHTVITIMLWA